VVLLGPDSVIDLPVLLADYDAVSKHRGMSALLEVIIHDQACLLHPHDKQMEEEVVMRISSTGSGSGAARTFKYFNRHPTAIIRPIKETDTGFSDAVGDRNIRLVNRMQYLHTLDALRDFDWVFECSQGVLLDTNFGIFPYVTSRTTLPHAALARNGLGFLGWTFVGVYRTYPIRTGGPSGPTGGEEIHFSDLGVPDEIATVTKRTRRIFKFSPDDFWLSHRLTHPNICMFTHLDYEKVVCNSDFEHWLRDSGAWHHLQNHILSKGQLLLGSRSPGNFEFKVI